METLQKRTFKLDSPRESKKTGYRAIDVNWPTKLTHPRIRPSRRRPTWHKDIVKRTYNNRR